MIPRDRPRGAGRRFDHLGAVLVTAVLAEPRLRPDRRSRARLGLARGAARLRRYAAVLAAAFVAVERRHPAPLVDLELVRRPVFAAANLAAATLMFVMLATSVYLSEFLQTFRDSTPLEAGLALLPLGAATALLAGVSGRLTARVPARTLIVAGLLCAAAGSAAAQPRRGPTTVAGLWPALLALGAGAGIALPATTATAVAAVARQPHGHGVRDPQRRPAGRRDARRRGARLDRHRPRRGTAAAYADGLSIALLVATGALIAVAALTLSVIR